jgi:hypothetical protein
MSAAGRGDEGCPRSVPVVGGAAFSGACCQWLRSELGQRVEAKSLVYEKTKSTAMCARRSKQGGRLAETKKCTDTGAPVSAKFREKSGAA